MVLFPFTMAEHVMDNRAGKSCLLGKKREMKIIMLFYSWLEDNVDFTIPADRDCESRHFSDGRDKNKHGGPGL